MIHLLLLVGCVPAVLVLLYLTRPGVIHRDISSAWLIRALKELEKEDQRKAALKVLDGGRKEDR
jgi:hypothetical protein